VWIFAVERTFILVRKSYAYPTWDPQCTPMGTEAAGFPETFVIVYQTTRMKLLILGKWPTWRTILFYVFIYIFNSVHISSTSCSSSEETNCLNTTPGSGHFVSVAVSCAGRMWISSWLVRWFGGVTEPHYRTNHDDVHFRPAHDTATDTQWQLPEVVLTQFVSPHDEHDVLETCRELETKINT
jgi:hypothetical protein